MSNNQHCLVHDGAGTQDHLCGRDGPDFIFTYSNVVVTVRGMTGMKRTFRRKDKQPAASQPAENGRWAERIERVAQQARDNFMVPRPEEPQEEDPQS